MNRTILAVLVSCLLVCFSCSGLQDLADQIGADQDNVEQIGDTLDDTGTSGMEIGPTDLDTLELTEIFDFVDAAEVELVSECAPGDGCFLDKCDDNEDCQSGWCVQYLGESICTQTCTEECPTGWNCKQVAGTDPDVIYICVSGYANLCRPCSGNADCTSIGAIEDACLDYGEGGNFCGGSCGPDESCPWGFSCQEISTIQGAVLSQCVADTGECPCTDNSVSLGLATPCSITNDAGTCDGLRVCTEDGLSDCDAAVPALETCNGVDDDCDGDVDEPDLVEGAFIHLCDDGNQCTADKCLEDQGCVNEPLEGGDCSDGNPCTVADLCTAGVCAGDPVQCDDENPCTDNICTETGGCEYPAAVGPCDDGNPCTVADQCSDTLCAGTPVSCDCQTDDDCSAFEDGNVCNGTLYCNLGKLPYLCAVDLDTIIECPQPEGPGAICLARSCDPDSGACSFVPANDGFLCDDDDKCTLPGTCTDGECIAGPQVNCNDGNPCTDDSCNPESGCIYTANSAACNDGDVCTTGDTCGEGKCMGGVALVCNDGDICNGSESCEAATGCVTGTPLVCEDNNLCTGTEWCDPVDGCKPGTPMICNDDNPCDGEETCDPAVGCLAGQPLVCDDGNLCNGKEVCDLTEGCLSGAPLDCDDLNPCTDDQCSFDIGCVHENNQAACDDSNLCTTGDHCQDGLCKGSGVQDCDDNNLCTDDSCDSVLGCVHKLNQAPCNDENVCTTGDHCELGACQGGGQIPCNDGNTCTTDSCNPQAGCEFTPDNAAECDDGSACTTGDFCKNGKCVVTSIKNCDDNNLCTDDSCDPDVGCVNSANTLPCDDGTVCTVDDTCAAKVCVPGPAMNCDDANLCTDDTCDALAGCLNSANSVDCDDSDKCTPFDQCVNKACVGSGTVNCLDDNICTDDSCTPELGCVNAHNTAACDDNSACTTSDICAAGLCTGSLPPDCDDLNPCTTDDCAPDSGCTHVPLPDNTDCGGDHICITGDCVSPCIPGSQTFTYTGSQQTFVVPEACKSVTIEAWGGEGAGGAGGATSGKGGYATGSLVIQSGETLYIFVGGHAKAFNGGGAGGNAGGGTGGGASDVRHGGTGNDNRVIVAGGGGGGGGKGCSGNYLGGNGGAGGGGNGGKGQDSNAGGGGFGGQPGSGGAAAIGCHYALGSPGNANGQGGAGQSCCCGVVPGGGGGGGGYVQGGGGGGASAGTVGCSADDKGGGGGGAGGTSYTDGMSSATSTQNGIQSGNGKVTISW